MCSIFGSKSKEEFFELGELNKFRGSHSHSVAVYNQGELKIMEKGFGALSPLDLPDAELYIGHQQAPTTEDRDISSIHPAEWRGSCLWHNGIIKDYQVKEWREDMIYNWTWDTQWLCYLLSEQGYDVLSEADGSFACLFFNNNKLQLFRNDNCPMFVRGTSFSSTKFEKSVALSNGVVYNYDMLGWKKTQVEFNTKEHFYWIPE